jgi:hypothetical protein
MSDASKNVAENVPRLILLAILASDSFIPCFFSRSANSRYPGIGFKVHSRSVLSGRNFSFKKSIQYQLVS